jgi:hypothetical protein
MILCGVLQGSLVGSYRDLGWGIMISEIGVFGNKLFRDLRRLFCIVKHTYQEMSGISIYESYCIFLNTLYDLVWGLYRGLVWGHTGIFGGVIQGSCVGSYRGLVLGPTG